MDFISRTLDLLNASGLKAFGIALASFVFLVCVGANFFFLPKELLWIIPAVTFLFLISASIVFVSALSWLANKLPKWIAAAKEKRDLRESCASLNLQETEILKARVEAGELTFYLTPFTQERVRDAVRLQSIYGGLAEKGIITVVTTDALGKIAAITTTRPAWKILRKQFAKGA
jgi:hypothetical protein